MTLSYSRSFFIGGCFVIAWTTHLLASGSSIIVPKGTQTEIYLNGVPDRSPSNYVFSFYGEGVPTIIVSQTKISYRYDSLRSRLSDVYIVNDVNEDADEEMDSNAFVNSLSNIHFEYDENNRLRRLSNSQGAFMLFFCEDGEKISKIIYNDGTVLFDSHSIFRNPNYPKELEQEEKLDCIKLLFAGSQTSPPDYYEIFYYRNAQNAWKFGYRWQPSIVPFEKIAEISKHYF